MNYETDNPTSHFPDNIWSNSFFPYINILTRHTSRYKTLIDNILHNGINANTISGNITTDISDHLAQFLITSYQVHIETKPKKILTRSFKSFVQDNFKYDLQSVDWEYTLDIHLHDANHLFEQFLKKLNNILDKHASLNYMSRKQEQNVTKPGITKGILKSIKIKNTLYNKFCRAKDNKSKSDLHNKFKKYCNRILTLSRKSKDSYFKSFFEEHKKNGLKIWQGINELVKKKPTKRPEPKSLHINKRIETNNLKIASEFNSFFNTIAVKIDVRIISTSFSFRNTLREPNENTIFLSPATVNEIESAIKELQDKKATGPNSIPSKILKNNKDVLSKPLCDLINLVFVSGPFPQQLKSVKLIPVYKKGDTLGCTNYCPISLLSI